MENLNLAYEALASECPNRRTAKQHKDAYPYYKHVYLGTNNALACVSNHDNVVSIPHGTYRTKAQILVDKLVSVTTEHVAEEEESPEDLVGDGEDSEHDDAGEDSDDNETGDGREGSLEDEE